MKRSIVLILASALLLPWIPLAAGEPAEGEEGNYVVIGGWHTENYGSPEQVEEYEPDGWGPDLRLLTAHDSEDASFMLKARILDGSTQNVDLDLDAARMMQAHVSFFKINHNLTHDPMTNLDAVAAPKTVRATDLDPWGHYSIRYSRTDSDLVLRHPSLPGLSLELNYGEQHREGMRQSMTMGHCVSCHVVSQPRKVNERTSDLGASLRYAFSEGAVDVSYSHRELKQGIDHVGMLYPRPIHPVNRTGVFGNRISYSFQDGVVPADVQPELERDTFGLDLSLPDLNGTLIHAGASWIETRNERTDLETDYEGYRFDLAHRFGKKWRFKMRARYYEMDSDDVYVDLVEPPTSAGPQAGLTYRDAHGFIPDYMRYSSINRDVFESSVEARYRFGKRAGSLRFVWDFRSVDRETFEVLGDSTKTTRNRYALKWRGRPWKKGKMRAFYEHTDVNHTFGNPRGACTTLTSPVFPNPFVGTQYYEWQNARAADPSGSPENADEFKVSVTHSFGAKATLSASARFWSGDNDEGNMTDWSKDSGTAMVSFWHAPAESVDWYANYTYQESELDVPGCIPLFDG